MSVSYISCHQSIRITHFINTAKDGNNTYLRFIDMFQSKKSMGPSLKDFINE